VIFFSGLIPVIQKHKPIVKNWRVLSLPCKEKTACFLGSSDKKSGKTLYL